MNLYRISQNVNNDYDTYDSAVVVAESEDAAKFISPDIYYSKWDEEQEDWYMSNSRGEICYRGSYGAWTHPVNVQVELLGTAESSYEEGKVIVSSFNAG